MRAPKSKGLIGGPEVSLTDVAENAVYACDVEDDDIPSGEEIELVRDAAFASSLAINRSRDVVDELGMTGDEFSDLERPPVIGGGGAKSVKLRCESFA